MVCVASCDYENLSSLDSRGVEHTEAHYAHHVTLQTVYPILDKTASVIDNLLCNKDLNARLRGNLLLYPCVTLYSLSIRRIENIEAHFAGQITRQTEYPNLVKTTRTDENLLCCKFRIGRPRGNL